MVPRHDIDFVLSVPGALERGVFDPSAPPTQIAGCAERSNNPAGDVGDSTSSGTHGRPERSLGPRGGHRGRENR